MATTATTILEQLGGNHFLTMTGANHMVALDRGIRFNIGRNGSKANVVKVFLRGDDTYTMQFWRKPREVNTFILMVKYVEQGLSDKQIEKKVQAAVKKSEPQMLEEYDGIYCDQLQELFTQYTKLYTRLV